MNRGLWMALLAGDILLIVSSVFFLWNRIQYDLASHRPAAFSPANNLVEKVSVPSPATPAVNQPVPFSTVKQPSPSSDLLQAQAGIAGNSTPPVASKTARNILFRYRDSVPMKVELIGDFNHWTPQPMRKDSRNNWTLRLSLTPGVYAYNFVVDGKMIRDPSNRKTKKAGRKILSSLLTVKPGKAAGKGAHSKSVSPTYQ